MIKKILITLLFPIYCFSQEYVVPVGVSLDKKSIYYDFYLNNEPNYIGKDFRIIETIIFDDQFRVIKFSANEIHSRKYFCISDENQIYFFNVSESFDTVYDFLKEYNFFKKLNEYKKTLLINKISKILYENLELSIEIKERDYQE